MYRDKTADWIWMPFTVVSGVCRGTGVLDGGEDRRRGRGSFAGKCGASRRNQRELCGVVILCREGRRRDSSHITLGFLVKIRTLLLTLQLKLLRILYLRHALSSRTLHTFQSG